MVEPAGWVDRGLAFIFQCRWLSRSCLSIEPQKGKGHFGHNIGVLWRDLNERKVAYIWVLVLYPQRMKELD